MTGSKTCGAPKAGGGACASQIGLCDRCGACIAHCEHRRAEREAARRKGGQKTARAAARGGTVGEGLDEGDLPPLDSYQSAQRWLEVVGRAVVTRRITHSEGQAAVRAVSEWVRAQGERLTAEVVGELKGEVERLKRDLTDRAGPRAVR